MTFFYQPEYQKAFTDAVRKTYYDALWVCYRDDQLDWIISKGISWFRQPVKSLTARLDQGGPEFLFKFLRIVSPHLPFERIVEADLEFLIQELNPIFYTYEYSGSDTLTDAWDQSKKWFPEQLKNGSLCIRLENQEQTKTSAVQSTLAALRLASFCILGSKMLVLDGLNAISGFDNTYQDPSGNEHYIFEVLHLEKIE